MTRDLTRSALLWAGLTFLFVLAGGLGAGVTAGLAEVVSGEEFDNTLYAIIFGACGYIAFRLALRVIDARAAHGGADAKAHRRS